MAGSADTVPLYAPGYGQWFRVSAAQAPAYIAQGWIPQGSGGGGDAFAAFIANTPASLDTGPEIAAQVLANTAAIGMLGPAAGSDAWLTAWGANVDALMRATSITRDANGAATAATVIWPDGTPGAYTATGSSSAPGAVDGYTVTYVPASGTTRTLSQPAVTRNSSGAITTRPAMTVA